MRLPASELSFAGWFGAKYMGASPRITAVTASGEIEGGNGGHEIGDAARAERHNDCDQLVRVVLRRSSSARGKQRSDPEQQGADAFHRTSPTSIPSRCGSSLRFRPFYCPLVILD